MATQTCIYRSVSLAAGETFVLPPGAEVITVSNLAAITSSCDNDLPQEELKCYTINWVSNIDPEGAKTVKALVTLVPFGGGLGTAVIGIPNTGNAWEITDNDTAAITIDKISIGGNPVTAGVNFTDFNSLEAAIAASPLSGILSERKYNHYDQIQPLTVAEQAQWGDWWRSGYTLWSFHFKSIPSLAETVYFEFLSALNSDGGNIGTIPRHFAKEIDCSLYPTTTEI